MIAAADFPIARAKRDAGKHLSRYAFADPLTNDPSSLSQKIRFGDLFEDRFASCQKVRPEKPEAITGLFCLHIRFSARYRSVKASPSCVLIVFVMCELNS